METSGCPFPPHEFTPRASPEVRVGKGLSGMERTMTLVGEPESELLNERPIPDALQNLERDEFFAETSEHFEALDSPFLPREAGEVAPDALSASVGQNCVNRSNDVRLVQRLLNAHLPIPLAPLVED